MSIRIDHCGLCHGKMGGTVLDLGNQPISNRLPRSAAEAQGHRYPLEIALCTGCGLPQLAHQLDADEHFHSDYAYLSGTSSTWTDHCKSYADDLMRDCGLRPGGRVVEVGSNDGTLLQEFAARGCRVLGVEPSGNVAEIANRKGLATKVAFFNPETAAEIRSEYGRARALVGNNVLAHVPDTDAFLRSARYLIASDGFMCFEFPHFINIIRKKYFDTIYHEHYTYLGVTGLVRWAQANDMTVFDVVEQSVHGGTLRVFLRHGSEPPPRHVQAFVDQELPFFEESAWRELQRWMAEWRSHFLALIEQRLARGEVIVGYAAASKATVALNFLGLTGNQIAYCCDAGKLKQGRYIPGAAVLISPPEILRKRAPDLIIVFAWNIFDEIVEVIRNFIDKPVDVLRPLPEIKTFRVVPDHER